MKRFFSLFFLLGIFSFPLVHATEEETLPTPPERYEWQLVWNDEFEGTQIDETKWESPEYKRRNGFWSKDSLSLDGDGHLKMKVFQNDEGNFIDGCLRTLGKYEKAKGYFTARVKFHHEVGHWSAFWLMGTTMPQVGNGSADGAEIDIMEKPTLDQKINCAIHWDGYGDDHKVINTTPSIDGIMEGFHTFSLWWGDDFYRFYVDGNLVWETEADGICTAPLYIKLSDEIGDWAGDIREANLPDETLVDYVRVYDLVPVKSR